MYGSVWVALAGSYHDTSCFGPVAFTPCPLPRRSNESLDENRRMENTIEKWEGTN